MSAATDQQCLSCLVAPLSQRRCASAAGHNAACALHSTHNLIHISLVAHSHSGIIAPAVVICTCSAPACLLLSNLMPAVSTAGQESCVSLQLLCMVQLTCAALIAH